MIPQQLQNDSFRFVLLKAKTKNPFEYEWQTNNNYAWDNQKLQEHLESGGNYGVIGGYGGLIILDADDPALQQKWIQELNTFAVRTCGGGYHFYFVCDEKIENRVLANKYGELRSDRYMVVGPNCYAIDEKKGHEGWYRVARDVPIEKISKESLMQLVKPYLRPEVKETAAPQIHDDSRSALEYREVIKRIAKGLSKEEIFKQMQAFAKWDQSPQQYREKTYEKALAYIQNKREEEPAKDILESQGYHIAKEIIQTGVPPIEYDITPYLRSGGITVIGGEPESKKTMLALYWAICMTKGAKSFDRFDCKKKKILYLDFENGLVPLVNRIKSLHYGNFGLELTDLENFHFIVNPAVRLNEENSKLFLEQWIERTGAETVIIDSFVGCFSGDENKSADVRNVFNNLRDFMVQGVSFIILHHTKKDNQGGMFGLRGSSDFGGMAECVLMLKPNKNFSNVELAKHRHMGKEGIPNWAFEIDQSFGEGSNYLKLKYHERDPETQDKFTNCLEDLERWVHETHQLGDRFKTDAANKAMERQGGYSRLMVSDALKKLLSEKILSKKDMKQGWWLVC